MPINNAVLNITEFDTYITPSGRAYNLHSPYIRWVRSREGTGMPPVEYITQRGPFQHGENILGFRLRPRVIQMLIRHNYDSRQQLNHGRLQILDVLRPNAQLIGSVVPGTLRKTFKDSSKIDIDVVIESGPNFEAEQPDQWESYSFNEIIRFVAHNPVFYNPYVRTHDFINVGAPFTELTFPITFPIRFERTVDPSLLVYNGTWIEYPSIVLEGPLANPIIITNQTTDETIRFNYEVLSGEVVTFTLTYGIKSVTSSFAPAVSLMGFLDADSDIGSFHIEPGTNTFTFALNGSSDSVAQLIYKERYIGY